MTATTPTPHPAPFSAAIIEKLEEIVDNERADLGREPWILDPFAGIGRVHELGTRTVGIELEPEWAAQHPKTICGDSTRLARTLVLGIPLGETHAFDMIVTSPCYGNRMADHHEAREVCRACKGTGWVQETDAIEPPIKVCPACNGAGAREYKRHTYRHYLGRPLTENSGAGMQWGNEYRRLHAQVWTQCATILRPGGAFVLNVKDHIRKGEVQDVALWHRETLQGLGLWWVAGEWVETPGQRHGANAELRMDGEHVWTFRKPLAQPRLVH